MSGGIVAELGVLFKADTSALEKGLSRARDDIKSTADAAEKGGGIIGSLTSGLGKLGLAGLGIGTIKGAVSGVVGSFGDLIGAAEAAGDAKARLDVVLGSGAMDAMVDAAAEGANALGLTQTAYLEASGAAANFLVNLGVGKDAAFDMAMGMTELAPKLAAFANADPSAVTDALQKGIAGSTRGLKELGIAINDDLLKGLDGAAKSAEIYRQIQEQSGPAAAAWADNQGDVANSMARVSAAMDDAKAAIGERLLPVIAPLAQWFADKLPGAIDAASAAVGKVTEFFAPLSTAISDFIEGFNLEPDMSFLDRVMNAFGNVSAGADGVSAVVVKMADTFESLVGYVQPAIDIVQAIAAKFVEFAGGPGKLMSTIIGTVLVVAFGALAVAAGSAAVSIIAALAPILIPIAAVVAAVVVLRKAWETNFGGIRDATATVVDWITTNVGPAISAAFEAVKVVLGGLAAWWQENGDMVIGIVRGIWDTVAGLFSVAFATIKGIVSIFLNVLHGNFEGAGKALVGMWAGIGAGLVRAVGGALSLLVNAIGLVVKNVVDAAIALGKAIIDGVLAGLKAAPGAITDFLVGMAKAAVLAVKKAWGIASPSKVFAAMGEQAVEGLRQGLLGMADLASLINETLGKIIGHQDRENFKAIAELTGSLLDIFTNTTKAIKALLSFDITTSAAQISAQFDALVGTFETALLRMKGLAQYGGRGDSPINFLNMFDVMNIETVSKGFNATIGLINGLLDIAAKIQTVKIPNAADIEALFEPLSKLGDVAARFIASVGTPEGEDATAYFNQGATTASALASWAKSIADIVGIKFGAVAKDFEAQMKAAAAASVVAWDAVKGMAMEWGQKGVSDRERLLTGIQAYAAAVGAATGILKAAAELDLSKAVLVTAEQLRKVADASVAAVGEIARAADWWIRAGKDVTGPIVDGIKAYADAAAVAVGLLKTAADLDFSKAVAVTTAQLHTAADLTVQALGEVLRVAGAFEGMAAEARTKLVQAVKDYADAAGAAIGLLGGTAGMDFSKAVAVTSGQLHDAANYSLMALGELERVAGAFVSMAAEARTKLVAGIKDFADAAGSAIDLLVKGAGGMNALGEVKRLAGIQPRLIRTILEQLRNVVDIVTDPKNAIKAPTEAQAAAIKALGDVGGVFDGIVKAAQGMNQLGEIKQLRGVQPRMIRTLLEQMAVVVAVVTDPRTALKPITADQAAAIKAIGDSSGVLSSLAGVADGFAKMSGKLTIPTDLAARVTTLVDAMRAVVRSITDAMTGDGAISLTDATTGANLAEAVKRIGESMGPIFDAINGALESPFGKIKAKGQRGDTFRQNIADRIKGAIVSAVTALNEALASMPTIDVPDALMTGVERLATVYDKILDILGKLDGVKIDAKALAALAAVPGILAGGLTGLDVQGSGGTITMSGGASGGGITINNTVTPTFMPMPVTMNNSITAPITVGPRVVEAVAVEVVNVLDIDIKLKPTGP